MIPHLAYSRERETVLWFRKRLIREMCMSFKKTNYFYHEAEVRGREKFQALNQQQENILQYIYSNVCLR